MATNVNFGTQQYFGFDPRTIPGCVQWLDAADTRTITTNVNGRVTAWADKSGAGASLTPLGANSNATIETNYRNGLSAINFAGLNQYQSPANTGVYPSDVYILVALKSLVRMDVISIGPTTADNFNSLTFSEHTNLRWHNGSTGFSRTPFTVSPTNETSTSLLLMNWSLAENNFIIRRNGVQLSLAAYTYTLPANSIIQIGFRHQNFATNLAFNAFVGEVVTYSRQLGLPERQQVEGYLAWKWGLAGDLATTHPYRYNPPAMRIFQPVDISGGGGTLLWLDAADTRTITGSPVTQWTDKSGRGSNAATGLGSVVAGTAINSQNTLRFGLNTTLNLSSFIMPSTQTSIFYIFRGITTNPNTNAGTGYFIFSRTADNFGAFSGNQQFFCYQNPPAARSYVGVMGPGGERNWGNLSTTAFFNATNIISTTGISYASSNGLSLPLVSTASVTNSAFTATTYQISTSRNVGDVYTFDLGELIVCDGTLSTADAQRMEGYLAWKWGIPRSLPTTHPYYNVLPSTVLFTPPQFAGLSLWLDAADSTTMSFSGGAITQWRDKSSNALVGTPVASPTLQTNSINGLSAVQLNGSTQYFTFGNVLNVGTSHIHTFAVARFTGNGAVMGKTSSRINSGRWGIYRLAADGGMIWLTDVGAGGVLAAFADTTTTPQVLRGSWDRAITSIGQNGTQRASVALVNTANYTNTDTFLVGAYGNNTGTGVQSGLFLNGVIGEIIVYFATLTLTQRQRVEGYLAWKWGLQSNLPTSHPFSSVRP